MAITDMCAKIISELLWFILTYSTLSCKTLQTVGLSCNARNTTQTRPVTVTIKITPQSTEVQRVKLVWRTLPVCVDYCRGRTLQREQVQNEVASHARIWTMTTQLSDTYDVFQIIMICSHLTSCWAPRYNRSCLAGCCTRRLNHSLVILCLS